MKFVKAPLDLDAIRGAEATENENDSAWFNVTRFTGMRRDESNRLQWEDIRFDLGMGRLPGTKTEDSDVWMPLATIVLQNLRQLYEERSGSVFLRISRA